MARLGYAWTTAQEAWTLASLLAALWDPRVTDGLKNLPTKHYNRSVVGIFRRESTMITQVQGPSK